MKRSALLMLALLAALPASAEIYKWKDADGKVHFSDTPPPSGAVKTIREAAPASARPAGTQDGKSADASKPKTLAEKELEFRQRRAAEAEAQAKAEKESADAAQRKRACEDARSNLAALNSGQRIGRYGSDGQRVILDDAARAEEETRVRKQVDDFCK
ncbi:DUF4124 domain-containing protein [Azoarcus sp. L1K30]|uniref:DUF4124 domain-containing protein n=1 Tax=Azoarcus sp. L1K30 TaxID=2820277 RepID=UPI001B826CCB|nr:DUF4124 domain-containing protein [Azoarcus sp. L1K30]MBR0565197.1 DUF4124 domain-containing protein [Azoarcus sp. L1K30]